jgi:histidine ammonia-lyase
MNYTIDNNWITLDQVDRILSDHYTLELGNDARKAIADCRNYLDEKIKRHDKLIYGINTGFGSLCNTAIEEEDLEQLQRNLVLSHACGTGEEVPQELVKRMLFLKILGLSHGNSGVQVETVERLIYFYNHSISFLLFTSKEV